MAWKKVTLSGDIVNADINASAAIAYSKLNLTNSIDSADYVDASIDEDHIAADAVNFATHLKAGTDGELITWDASGNPAAVAVGTEDHVLTSNGSGAAPTFQAAGSAATRGSLNLDTDDSPQFAGVNLGHASQTTLTGSSGVLSVEGKAVYQAGGTDVAVIDGGTGSSTAPMIGLVTAANAGAARTALGVAIGSDVQAYDAQLATLAGASSANATAVTNLTGTNSGDDADTTGNATTATTASIATTVTLTDEGTDSTCFPVFAQTATGNIAMETDASAYKYNASNGSLSATTFIGALTGNASGSSATCSGLAGSATILASARNIGGVSFNGSANIDLPGVNSAGNQSTSGQAGTVATIAGLAPNTATTQATQAAITSAANLVTVGTITAGAWRGDTIDAAYGGTGATSMTALKNLLDDETWTFANKVTLTGDLDVKGTTTTINSTDTSFTDTSIQLNVADGEAAFGDSASAIVFGDSTGSTSTGRIINTGTAGAGFKFMDGNATNTPSGNNNVSDGANYVDIRVNGLVLKTQSEPTTEVEGMIYWNGSNLYVGNPS